MNIIKKTSMVIALLGIFIAFSSFGSDASSQEAGRRQDGPPPEAYSACEGKSVGDTAQFVSPRGETVTGRCEQEGERLVLRGETATGNNFSFSGNGDGTVTDNVPGLMWQQNPDTDGGGIDADDKLFPDRAGHRASTLKLDGYTDWLFPTDWLLSTIKKLELGMAFWGLDPSGYDGSDTANEGGSSDSVDSSDGDGNFVDASGYAIVDTGQIVCYDDQDELITCPAGESFYGQDSQHDGWQPSYTDNGDGTVTDNITGLMWQQDPGDKTTYDEAVSGAESFTLAGYDDWRLPTIKELYSLILFSGLDPSGMPGDDTTGLVPFIDTDYFDFEYGNPDTGERIIDSQWATSTEYVNITMGGNQTMFGVNLADGRIKGYPIGNKTYFVIYVRGNTAYGINDFSENNDGTVTDNSTGLMWMQQDSGYFAAGDDNDGALSWEQALEWAENLEYAGHSDWRLPNAKELQSIVDYTRSPATTGSAAIDPVFSTSVIIDEGGNANYPFYWTSTTHANAHNGANAAYIAFGEALGWMQNPFGDYTLMDVHGAGAQRSDPKIGDPADYPYGRGPQGDVIRIYNYVRCVRDMNDDTNPTQPDDIDTTKVSEGYIE